MNSSDNNQATSNSSTKNLSDLTSKFNPIEKNLVIFCSCLGGLILFTYIIAAVGYILKQKKRIRDDKLMTEHSDIGASKYLISIFTAGPERGTKPTSAKVTIHLFGSKSPGKIHELKPKGGFMPYTREKFVVNEDVSLGVVSDLLIQTDNAGDNPKWFCRSIIVRSLETNDAWYFFVNAVIEFPPRILTSLTSNDLLSRYFIARRCFRREWRQGQHVYYGFLNWSPRSVYTIGQRLVTALVANLYLIAMTLLIINFIFEPWKFKKTRSKNMNHCLDKDKTAKKLFWSILVIPIPMASALFTLLMCVFLVRLFRDPENYEQRFDEMDFVIDTALKATADKKHGFRLSLLLGGQEAMQKRIFVDEKSKYHVYAQIEEKSRIFQEDEDDDDDDNLDDKDSVGSITSITLIPKVNQEEIEEETQIIKSKLSKSGRGIKENVYTSHHQSKRESAVQQTLNWQQLFHGPIKSESHSSTEHFKRQGSSSNRGLVENISIRRLSCQKNRKTSDLARQRAPEELRAEMRQLFNLINVDASGNAIRMPSNSFSEGVRGSIDYDEMQKVNITIGMIDLIPKPRNKHDQPKLAWVFAGVSVLICIGALFSVFLFPNFTECSHKEVGLLFFTAYLSSLLFGIVFEMGKIIILTIWHMKTDKHYYNSINYLNNVHSLNEQKNTANIVENTNVNTIEVLNVEAREETSEKGNNLSMLSELENTEGDNKLRSKQVGFMEEK